MNIKINDHIVDIGHNKVTILRIGNTLAKAIVLPLAEDDGFSKVMFKIKNITLLDNDVYDIMSEYTKDSNGVT